VTCLIRTQKILDDLPVEDHLTLKPVIFMVFVANAAILPGDLIVMTIYAGIFIYGQKIA
tara:strand:- start:235 stop:411 length:177 start_codon:yes stop_codon:yes gene_type:complete